jgi:hypothetical protein
MNCLLKKLGLPLTIESDTNLDFPLPLCFLG